MQISNEKLMSFMEWIMHHRVDGLETTDTVAGSSNFGKFMELFESEDSRWIDEINAELEK